MSKAMSEKEKENSPFGDPYQTNTYSGGNYPPRSGREVRSDALEGYNPFEQDQNNRGGGPAVLPSADPTPPPPMPTGGQPPAYSASGGTWAADKAELERRQRELEAKANEIEKREEEARRREEEARRSGAGVTQVEKNWPPIPAFCPCQPCFYQDIDVEIPTEFRSLVRVAYYVFLMHPTVMILNVFAALAFFIANIEAKKDTHQSGTTFGLSIIFFFLFTPLAFICWFRPLYKAFRSDSSFNFMLFFFIFACQCVVVIIQAVGINWFASCGWINALQMVSVNLAASILMMVMAALFTALAVIDIILIIKVHRVYRGTGASITKARQEFTEGVSKNEVVREAAADLGAAAARGAASAATR